MTSPLERLKSEAARFKKAFRRHDPAAIARLRAVFPERESPRHADFLHVVARENGHESWPRLKFALETAAMTRAERADRLRRGLFHGQNWVVDRLLGDEPDLPDQSLDLQIALYDIGALRDAIGRDPAAATRPIGRRTPILHLAFSHYIHMAPDRREDMLEVAELLVACGADVNDGFPPEPDADHRLSALYGALGHAGNMALAEWLLDHGADPDDNESLYHATELGHTQGLELLMKHGVSTRGTNALPRALDFDDPAAIRLLLEYGADPNEAVAGHPSGQPVDTIPALHQAARRWCSAATGALLLDHGADPEARWSGHTAYATACIFGNHDMAGLFEERALAHALSATETVLARCARGETPGDPLVPSALSDEDARLLTHIARKPSDDALAHMRALVAAGLDPDLPDDMGLTPLHVAGWEGYPDRVAFFLSLGLDLAHVNAFGGDALGTVIHGAEFCPDAGSRDHVGCARLLLEAGAKLDPREANACGNEEMARFLEDWLDQA